MNSSIVNKHIRGLIKPYLQENGFVASSSRNFLKHNDDEIWVLNFQSYNSYNADVMNVTSFSFAINLGIFWKRLPTDSKIKLKDNVLFPQEYQCEFRHCLQKGIIQKETKFKTVWYVDEEGQNLDLVLNDAFAVIRKNVPAWFVKFSDKQASIRHLLEKEEEMEGTWGFGRKDSPHRNLLIGYLAYWTGNNKLANERLQAVFESGSYLNLKGAILEHISLTEQ